MNTMPFRLEDTIRKLEALKAKWAEADTESQNRNEAHMVTLTLVECANRLSRVADYLLTTDSRVEIAPDVQMQTHIEMTSPLKDLERRTIGILERR